MVRTFRWLPGVALAAGLLAGCSITSSHTKVSSITLQQPPIQVLVASPRLSASQTAALIPPDHLWGLIQGQFLTCGPVGHVLKPHQMAREPVTVSLLYKGAVVDSVHLVRQPRFDFVIIGPRKPMKVFDPNTHEQAPLWNASLVVRTSQGHADAVLLGGIPGYGGALLSYPNQPPVHPCVKGSPDY
jgi:hypothetical protein